MDLSNLKSFSLTCHNCREAYDTILIPTLRRMSYLEELTLYVHIFDGPIFVSGTDLDEQILIHMPRLHAFSFYLAIQNAIGNPIFRVTNDQIEQTFANGKYRQVIAMVDYFEPIKMISRVFSLPCKFSRLDEIGNNIPNIVFNTVTHVSLWDKDAFRHEFFVRFARAFPYLRSLSVMNIKPPSWSQQDVQENEWPSPIEYPHLISLDIDHVHSYYVEHFLNGTKSHLPRLEELTVRYYNLEEVTENFARIETQRTCARVKRLFLQRPMAHGENFYRYFPSLSV